MRKRVHKEIKKNRNADAHAAHDHTRLDFVITLNFGRDAEPSLHLQLAHFGAWPDMNISATQVLPQSNFLPSGAQVPRELPAS